MASHDGIVDIELTIRDKTFKAKTKYWLTEKRNRIDRTATVVEVRDGVWRTFNAYGQSIGLGQMEYQSILRDITEQVKPEAILNMMVGK